ncbi:MAG: ring-cleaving dioxygenase [Phycisphaerales bacterium]
MTTAALATPGIHHITALARDPKPNIAFYAGLLGQRLIKRTVNYDDPSVWHLYYADDRGTPGSVMTFFPNPDARRPRFGSGELSATAYAAPPGSLGFWHERLTKAGITAAPFQRFGEQGIAFADHDGTRLEIIERVDAQPSRFVPVDPAAPHAKRQHDHGGPIPTDMALRGFHSATLDVDGYEHSARLLTGVFGLEPAGSAGERYRFERRDQRGRTIPAGTIDLRCRPALDRARMGHGSTHHIAWRATDDEHEHALRAELVSRGHNATPIIDRQYFHSIYFREPGGVIFEIATDPPGFTTDEPPDHLGESLMLPTWLEERRNEIANSLPPLE